MSLLFGHFTSILYVVFSCQILFSDVLKSSNACLMQCLPVNWMELQTTHLLFMGINIMMWLCLYNASTIDPGFLPRNIPEYDRAIKEVCQISAHEIGTNVTERLKRCVRFLPMKHCTSELYQGQLPVYHVFS